MPSLFPLPLCYTAWGTLPGGGGGTWSGYVGLATQLKAAKIRTVAVQISQVDRGYIAELQNEGLFVVAWDRADYIVADPRFSGSLVKCLTDTEVGLKPNGVLLQVEGISQRDGALALLTELSKHPEITMPREIITTYAGMDTVSGAPKPWQDFAALGVTAAHVECYAADDPNHANLNNMLYQGTVYGIPADKLIACCGTYRGELPAQYTGLDKLAREFSIYLAEPMSKDQWTAWGAVNYVTTVYYWRLTAGAAVLHEERAITYADGTTGLGKMLSWMELNVNTIRAAGAVDLQRVLEPLHAT